MSKSPTSDLPKAYNHTVEGQLTERWEAAGIFAPPPRRAGERTFSILMPPPNANGTLHVGHGVGIAVQDALTRYHRMRGDATLWLPGLDHAGFETQVVFEKQLEKQGTSRFEMDRDALYAATLAFTKENSARILEQMKRLGVSADWERLFFTLDDDLVDQVYDTFVQLSQDGLAFRDERPVHWCTKHQTTLSDLEVKDDERTDPLYYIKYGPLVLATTRPETKFGDTAVAVHPEDERYQQYIGHEIEIETVLGPTRIKVIADEMVDPAFGTGVVKITPAHDANDFEVGRRHNLPSVEVVDQYGKMNEKAGPYAGLRVDEARQQVAADMAKKGLIERIDEGYRHSVKVCYKCRRTIEPRVIPQWFIAVSKKGTKSGQALAPDAMEAVGDGRATFVTERFRKIFAHWMDTIRDWPVSRQIVWGIRLPIWYCRCGRTIVQRPRRTELVFVRHGESEHNLAGIMNGDPSQPYHLTPKGQEQMEADGKRLAADGAPYHRIISSEMPRVRESAEILARHLGLPVTVDARLNDIGLGGLDGQPKDTIQHRTKDHERSVEGSETLDQVSGRIGAFLASWLADDTLEGQRILVVTSEVPFWAVSKHFNPSLGAHHTVPPIRNGESHCFQLGDLAHCPSCGELTGQRDTDVFDTWFSSGQLPVIANRRQRFPDDFKRFYPTTVMETGWEIIFFWVARMIMFGLYLTGEVPFRHIYLHGMVRDKDRQKMSKSKGNVIDPLGVIDQYGADALRMALIFGTAAGNDMPMSEEKIRGMRNFANKFWNVSRFIVMNLSGGRRTEDGGQTGPSSVIRFPTTFEPQTSADRRILDQLDDTVNAATRALEEFRFHEYAQAVYQFLWTDLADTYLEAAKTQRAGGTSSDGGASKASDSSEVKEPAPIDQNTQRILLHVLVTTLKLIHPIMPFVTEAVWQQLPTAAKDHELLAASSWPKATG